MISDIKMDPKDEKRSGGQGLFPSSAWGSSRLQNTSRDKKTGGAGAQTTVCVATNQRS